MSKIKLIKKVLTEIKQDPNLPKLINLMEVELKKYEAKVIWFKKWIQIAVLLASIAYNVLVSLGIW
jgi:hypothetical protein